MAPGGSRWAEVEMVEAVVMVVVWILHWVRHRRLLHDSTCLGSSKSGGGLETAGTEAVVVGVEV